MNRLSLQQLVCFDALVTAGGFQAAADSVGRSHPTVFMAIKNLEAELGVRLFDRDGYRVSLTDAGKSLHARTRILLAELTALRNEAMQLAMGAEVGISVVIGDLSPIPETLELLQGFFKNCPGTQLHLHFEAISGPWERLVDGDADLIIHHVEAGNSQLESIDLCKFEIVPVVAPGFLSFPITRYITPEQMRPFVQCVIRDTATHSPPREYHLIDGARRWTVSDQHIKKELILRGMVWGHMPRHLIENELRAGRLVSIGGRYLPGARGMLTASRLRNVPRGPVASRLWQFIEQNTASFDTAVNPSTTRSRRRKKLNRRARLVRSA